ncbi:MAG: B12-binding domain-containing radical SAM protein [Acidobacteria bacterium]|nr:B12-binding domain-containing radical SAM protein [Acidobacteriota bacterium]
MKVSLVHGRYFNSWEALGLGYIGAYIQKQVPEAELNFFQGCFDSDEEIVKGCAGSDVVAFSCTTPTFPHAMELSRRIKRENPEVWTVHGGYHASADPTPVPEFDTVVVGEGEAAMADILNGDRRKLVPGRMMSFDELPWPDRSLIRNERNIQVAYNDNRLRIASFQSHRACPFQCKYCLDGFNKVLYPGMSKGVVRYRRPADVVSEIEAVAGEYRLDLVKFSDPTWNTSIQWVNEFCWEKIRRGVDIMFYPNVHATMCSPEMMDAMRRAGCYEIAVGVESGSPKILKQIGKGTTVQSIRNCVAWAKAAGILVRGYFILGMPEETHEDLELTEQFAEELALAEYGFTILCPYPGTQMYSSEQHRDIKWELTDEYSNDFWATKFVTNQELKEWQRKLTKKFSERLTWHNRALLGQTGVGVRESVAEGSPDCRLTL